MAAFSVLGTSTQETPDSPKRPAVVLVSEPLWPFILSEGLLRSHHQFLLGALRLVGAAVTRSLHTMALLGTARERVQSGNGGVAGWPRSRVVAALCFGQGVCQRQALPVQG